MFPWGQSNAWVSCGNLSEQELNMSSRRKAAKQFPRPFRSFFSRDQVDKCSRLVRRVAREPSNNPSEVKSRGPRCHTESSWLISRICQTGSSHSPGSLLRFSSHFRICAFLPWEKWMKRPEVSGDFFGSSNMGLAYICLDLFWFWQVVSTLNFSRRSLPIDFGRKRSGYLDLEADHRYFVSKALLVIGVKEVVVVLYSTLVRVCFLLITKKVVNRISDLMRKDR